MKASDEDQQVHFEYEEAIKLHIVQLVQYLQPLLPIMPIIKQQIFSENELMWSLSECLTYLHYKREKQNIFSRYIQQLV